MRIGALLLVLFAAVESGAQATCESGNVPEQPDIDWEGQFTGCTSENGQPCATFEPIVFHVAPTQGPDYTDCESFLWDFGDGTTSDLREPTHLYATTGNYFVTVVVRNQFGEAGTGGQLTATLATLNPIIDQFTASSYAVKRGQPVTITWATRYTYRVRISPIGIDTPSASGTYTFTPAATAKYTLQAEGPPSSTYLSFTITVTPLRRRSVRH